jgi:hypothetical protein
MLQLEERPLPRPTHREVNLPALAGGEPLNCPVPGDSTNPGCSFARGVRECASRGDDLV